VEPLIAVLGDTNYQVQKNARQILERIKRPAVEPLINALKDGNEDTRRNSAMVLGTIKDPRAIEPLIKTLKDKCEYVRAEAYFSLIDITKNFDLKENFAECMNWWQENKGKFLKNK
jgi:HEAT repeat protein